jgi:glycine dehydrogenase subunit 1
LKFRYLPVTEQDKQEMLEVIGVDSVAELFADIPEKVRFKGEMNLKEALSEPGIVKELGRMASKKCQ